MKNKKLNYLLLLLFTLLVLIFSLKDNFYKILHYILNMNIWWLLYSVLLIFGYWFFKALDLKVYVDYYTKKISFKKIFKLEMETLFFNGITPFSSGGQPFQVLAMKKAGIRLIDGTNIIVITSFIHQLSIFILAFISVIANIFFKLLESSTVRSFSILGFIINIIFMFFLLVLCFSKKFKRIIIRSVIKILNALKIVKNKRKVIDKWEDKINSLDEGAKIIRKNKKGFIIAAIYNLIALIALYLTPLSIACGMGLNTFTGIQSIIITTYVELIGMFVPIPGGTGGLEYAFVTLFGGFVGGEAVMSLMLVWRFITYYFGMILGGIILNISNKRNEA